MLSIDVPSLRERRDDIPVLIEFFLKSTLATIRATCAGSVPRRGASCSNTRGPETCAQLESAIERAILLCESDLIAIEDLPLEVRQETKPAAEFV
ncbi:MAG: hypothetical protein WKF30_13430 [Pyrinomonadaceae bacterium]